MLPPRSIRSLIPSASQCAGLIEIRVRRSNACDSDSRQGLRDARHRLSKVERYEIEPGALSFQLAQPVSTFWQIPLSDGRMSDCDGFSGPNDPIN